MTAPDLKARTNSEILQRFVRWTGYPDIQSHRDNTTHWFDTNALLDALVAAERERDAWMRLVVALDNQGTHASRCIARDIGGLVCAGCEAVDGEAAEARAAVNTEARTDG